MWANVGHIHLCRTVAGTYVQNCNRNICENVYGRGLGAAEWQCTGVTLWQVHRCSGTTGAPVQLDGSAQVQQYNRRAGAAVWQM